MRDNPEHRAVDGGFECDDCGRVYQTPLGFNRHRSLCTGGDSQ